LLLGGNAIICAVAVMGPVGETEGGIRMAPGTCTRIDSNACRLEIFHNFQWGSICPDTFTTSDAAVACKQLGRGWMMAQAGLYNTDAQLFLGQEVPAIVLHNLGCTGSEMKLGDCPGLAWDPGADPCSDYLGVGIYCGELPPRVPPPN